LIRQALQGKAVRFVFDRPPSAMALAEGLDRRCPGVLVEIGVDVAALARRADVAGDVATFMKKLPSLARIAVSAAAQKRQFLRTFPPTSALKREFLTERSAAVVIPLCIDGAVRQLTGESLSHRGSSVDLAVQILRSLTEVLTCSGQAINLDLRLDGP